MQKKKKTLYTNTYENGNFLRKFYFEELTYNEIETWTSQ